MIEPDYLEEYRPNVGICLLSRQGKVWVGRRSGLTSGADKQPHIWQMPQGGIDSDEDIDAAARRELYEETGAKSVRILAITPGWLVYEFPEGYRKKKKRKWLGQRQKWVAMLFEGDEREIDLDAHNEKEFDDWRWTDLNKTPELIIPFKRGVYEEVVTAFNPLAAYLRKTA